MNCVIQDWQGKEAGKASLDLKVAKESSAADLIHRAVVRQLANSRQGTASTLTRAEVHRSRPSGFDPHPPASRWWCDLRSQAPLL